MTTLTDLGCTTKHVFRSSSTNLNGVQVSSNESTEFRIGLPRVPAVQAVFSKEGLGKKLVKLFKQELQTGDQAFDQAVYISTDTLEATQAMLGDASLRALIAELVAIGGPVSVEGQTLTLTIPGHSADEPPEAEALVRALLG